jgi:RHS repeat-associated protein
VNYEYDAYGNRVKALAGTQPVWELTGAGGTTTTSLLGGTMTATTTHNSQGLLTGLKTVKGTATIRNMDFAFNGATGNLTSRTGMLPQKETFYYDNLDRLTGVKQGSPESLAMSIGYAANGNITSKTGLGIYSYNASKVHALSGVDNTGGLIPDRDQAVTYNAFNKIAQISETAGDEIRQLDIAYGPDQQRWKTELRKNGSVTKTVIYAGDYERVIKNDTTTHLYYIEGGGIHVRQVKGASTLLKDGRYYIHPDHLGSLTLITDATGGTVQKCSFDAWGKRTFITKTPSLVFDRGFTGHEHLDEFGLINMNGRMYDPVVGRFLSPDPFVQAPEFSQSFNRYSYALNNPLIYTDPSGEIVWFVPVIIGAAIGAYSGYKIADAKGYSFKDGSMYGHILGGAVIGGLAGGVGAGISAAGGAAWWAGAAAGAIGGAGFSGMATGWDGSAMLTGAVNGAIAGLVGGYAGSMVGGGWGALVGGASSNLTSQLLYNDGNFSKVDWGSVAGSGAFSLGMYHAMSFASWKWGGGNKVGDVNIKYSTYLKMNATLQRSRAWKREGGFWINEDGTYENFNKDAIYKKHAIRNVEAPTGNAKYLVHTHWHPDGLMIDPVRTITSGSPYSRTAESFIPSRGDVNTIYNYGLEGITLTNQSILQYTGINSYTNHWNYPMLRYFPLHWWY